MRNPSLISLCALPVPIILFVVFHRMWLVIGNGNPNYIFFQCLAYGMFVLIITMDFVSATVKRDKVRRMVEKGTIKKHIREKQGMGEEADNCHSTVSTAPSRIGGK
jgi:phosphatidylinositol glycan class U